MGDKDGKTEKPTPKRIRDSRKRGEVAKSPDVVAAVALFVFAMLFVPLFHKPLLALFCQLS